MIDVTPRCHCCDATGKVEGADGNYRPCSLYRDEDFTRWHENRLTLEQRQARVYVPGDVR